MPVYVRLIRFTGKGVSEIKNLKEKYEDAKRIIEAEKGRILATYVTLGRYDMVGVIEVPDDKAAMKISALIGAKGDVAIETLPAITMQEFAEMMKK